MRSAPCGRASRRSGRASEHRRPRARRGTAASESAWRAGHQARGRAPSPRRRQSDGEPTSPPPAPGRRGCESPLRRRRRAREPDGRIGDQRLGRARPRRPRATRRRARGAGRRGGAPGHSCWWALPRRRSRRRPAAPWRGRRRRASPTSGSRLHRGRVQGRRFERLDQVAPPRERPVQRLMPVERRRPPTPASRRATPVGAARSDAVTVIPSLRRRARPHRRFPMRTRTNGRSRGRS